MFWQLGPGWLVLVMRGPELQCAWEYQLGPVQGPEVQQGPPQAQVVALGPVLGQVPKPEEPPESAEPCRRQPRAEEQLGGHASLPRHMAVAAVVVEERVLGAATQGHLPYSWVQKWS